MGFTREQIVELYAGIFERFGFDKREEEMSSAHAKSLKVSAMD